MFINTKGGLMQQRYCGCGCIVWVQYLFSDMECRTLFWSTLFRNGSLLDRCPCCGDPLDIDDLY